MKSTFALSSAALLVILGFSLTDQVLAGDTDIMPAAIETLNAVVDSQSFAEESSSYAISPRFKRHVFIDQLLCTLRLQSCQAILHNIVSTSDPVANMQAGCRASLQSFKCLVDAISNCPLPPTVKTNMNTTLNQIIEGFTSHCNDDSVVAEYRVEENLECMENTTFPLKLCTSIYVAQLFSMTGQESNREFCCQHLGFLQCIGNKAASVCTTSAKSVLVRHVAAMFGGVSRARSTDNCASVKYSMCGVNDLSPLESNSIE